MPMQGSFNAQQFKPSQIAGSHPVGKFDFQISNTTIEPTKDQSGGMFIVEFTTPSGSIVNRYNIWNSSPKAVEIAHGQLSALCHAVGVFQLDWQNDGAALRGARGKVDIGYQKGEEPSTDKPAGGYVEVKHIYDVNGNEPGKAPMAAPQPQQPAGNGQWSGPAPAPASAPAPAWQPPNGIGQPAQNQPTQGWSQGPAASTPPWGSNRQNKL